MEGIKQNRVLQCWGVVCYSYMKIMQENVSYHLLQKACRVSPGNAEPPVTIYTLNPSPKSGALLSYGLGLRIQDIGQGTPSAQIPRLCRVYTGGIRQGHMIAAGS